MAGSTAARAFASALLLACAACTRDFDGLFPPAEGSSGASGTSGKPQSSGGPDECACTPCNEPTCDFKCPTTCASCDCGTTTCTGKGCSIFCRERALCDVSCPAGADCTCSGDGCGLSCPSGKPLLCGDLVTCKTECP